VIYDGHLLYLFVKDQKPGDIKGHAVTAFGAAWYALSPAGSQITGPPSSSAGSASSGASGGY
jgi:hypothetical protein